MIPLLMEELDWPPRGTMGPIFSEYIYIQFYQQEGDETGDNRFWPIPKFQELLMQLNFLRIMPDSSIVTKGISRTVAICVDRDIAMANI
jgi:hypothetical protein